MLDENNNDRQQQIENLQGLLNGHRRTLAHLLKQQAMHGEAFTPPSVAHGIDEARKEIQITKERLRILGVDAENLPDDVTEPLPVPDHSPEESWTRSARYLGGVLIFVLIGLLAMVVWQRNGRVGMSAIPPSAMDQAIDATSTSQESVVPDFVASTVFDLAQMRKEGRFRQVTYVPVPGRNPTEPISDALKVTQIEYGFLAATHAPAWSIRITFTNTTTEAVFLDLTSRFFELSDAHGHRASLVYFCCVSKGRILRAGQTREIQFIFESHPDWHRPGEDAEPLFIRVTGFVPIARAEWSFTAQRQGITPA
jgi:hypothetical protein